MARSFAHSLSLRLLVIFLIFGALFVLGTVLALRWVYKADDLRSLISGHLQLHVEYVRQDIGDPPSIERALAITEQVPVDIRIVGPDMDWASDAEFPAIEQLSFGASRYFSAEPDAWLNELRNVEFAEYADHRFMRLLQGPYSIIVSTTKISDDRHGPPLLPIVIGMGLSLVLLAYLAVRWLFLPIGDIRYGAARIGRGDLAHRIRQRRADELGDLAQDVNTLAADVQSMLDAKRQLLLGISHELRTPLSRLKLALELLRDQEAKSGLAEDIGEMESIIATLLEAERLNDRHVALHRSDIDLRCLIAGLVADFFPHDDARIEVNVESSVSKVRVDGPRIVLLLKNLLSNAVRHTGDARSIIRVDVTSFGGTVEIAVSDRGPGIPQEQAEHLFEPFWRGDPSRTRNTGGSGLGLYLARLVAEAHGGTLTLDASYRDGARLCLQLPKCDTNIGLATSDS